MAHICVGKLNTIGSANGLSPGWRRAIIWTNAGKLLIRTLGTDFSEIISDIHTFPFKKKRLKMSSEKCCHFVSASTCYSHPLHGVTGYAILVKHCYKFQWPQWASQESPSGLAWKLDGDLSYPVKLYWLWGGLLSQLAPFSYFLNFQHSRNTSYLFSITFMFENCCHSSAAVTPNKYECG